MLGSYDFADQLNHLIGAWVLVMSFALLYQRRLYGVLKIYLLQSLGVGLAALWQGHVQLSPHLYVSAATIFLFKVVLIPFALQKMVARLAIQRTLDTTMGIGLTLVVGVGLVVLALFLVLPVTTASAPFTRLNLALALSVLFLGLLMMVSRHNAIMQVIGFLSLENGLDLAAVGVRGMPLVVEMGIAVTVLVSFLIVGMFIFRIRERFDLLNIADLAQHRGEEP